MFSLKCISFLILVSNVFSISLVGSAKKHPYVLNPNPCESDRECDGLDNGKCVDGFCKCGDSNVCEDTINLVVSKIGEACQYLKDCNIARSKCDFEAKRCVCEDGLVKSNDSRKCLIVSEGIGDQCIESVQCDSAVKFSKCFNQKCFCKPNYHEDNGTCYENIELGAPCEDDIHCSHLEFSKCLDSKCSCMQDFVANTQSNQCLIVAKSEKSPCIEDVQCTTVLGGSSHCSGGFCECKELYQLKPQINKCVRDMLLGDTCMVHQNCHGPMPGVSRLECVLGVCKCNSFYAEIDGYCINSAGKLRSSITIAVVLFVLMYLK